MRSRTVERLSSTLCIIFEGHSPVGSYFCPCLILGIVTVMVYFPFNATCAGFKGSHHERGPFQNEKWQQRCCQVPRLCHRQLEISCGDFLTGWWFHFDGYISWVAGLQYGRQHSRNSTQKDAGSSHWSLRLCFSSFSKNWDMFSCLWLKGLCMNEFELTTVVHQCTKMLDSRLHENPN